MGRIYKKMMTPSDIWSDYKGNLKWLKDRTLVLMKHGSHAYGTNTPTSDIDIKGVVIPPREYLLGFLDKFEQADKGWESLDCVLFEFRKFFNLAADNNPNMIELPFVDSSDWITSSLSWEIIVKNKELFISQNCKHRFSGYAVSQLKRIHTHRRWLISPPTHKPERQEFGLPDYNVIPKEQREALEAMMLKMIEGWQVDFACIDDGTRIDLLNKLSTSLADMKLSADDQYVAAGNKLGLDAQAMEYLKAERAYRAALAEWTQYQTWLRERNPVRAAMEAQFGYDCYREDTEFLTNNGWKKYHEVTKEDLLATVNINNHNLEYQKYTNRICKKYTGELIEVSNQYSNFAVTPKHKLLVLPSNRSKKNNFKSTHSGNWKLAGYEELISGRKSHFHTLNVFQNTNKNFEISDQFLTLLGLFVSEGSYLKYKTNSGIKLKGISISQLENGKACKYIDSLTEFKISECAHKRKGRNELTFNIYDKNLAKKLYSECGEYSKSKHLPNWFRKLSTSQARVLLDALVAGDGTHKKYSNIYYTASKQLANEVHELALLAGYNTKLWDYSLKNRVYQVYFKKQAVKYGKLVTKGKQSHVKKTAYDGNVVCFEVPNSTLVTRLNGEVSIQGNCKHAMHLVRLFRMCKEILSGQGVLVKRPDAQELLAIRNGAWKFDELIEWASKQEAESEALLKTTKIPKTPNRVKLNEICIQIIEYHLR